MIFLTLQAIIIMIIRTLIYWTLTRKLCEAQFTDSSQPHKVDVFIPIVIIIMRKQMEQGVTILPIVIQL